MMSSSVVNKKPESENRELEENSPISVLLKRCKKYDGVTLPRNFQNFADQIRKLEVRTDDIWLCGVPMSGISWIQKVVWCIANLEDYETTEKSTIEKRFPLFERQTFFPEGRKPLNVMAEYPDFFRDSLAYVEKLPTPRFIKTHLPFVFLPEKLQTSEETKIVYVARNPRDVCTSFYHYARIQFRRPITPDFDSFCKHYMKGEFEFLPYWDHVLRFWRMRHNSNVLFVTCEEMEKDLKKGVVKVANFLGRTLEEGQVQNLVKHLSFDTMKNDGTGNRESRIRFGQPGHWMNLMTDALELQFQKWEEEHLRDTDYPLILDM